MTLEPCTAIVLASAATGASTMAIVVALIVIGSALAVVSGTRGRNRGHRRDPHGSHDRPLPTRPTGRGSSRPRTRPAIVPYSYWYALVPFEDTTQVKERPVLVLRQDGTNARVLKVTSQDKRGREGFHRVDTRSWDRPGTKSDSWVHMDVVVTVPLSGFRRCLGSELDTAFTQLLSRKHGNEFF